MPIIRPGREMDSEVYTLEEQMDHCIHIAFLCYGLFDAVINAPELKSRRALALRVTFSVRRSRKHANFGCQPCGC